MVKLLICSLITGAFPSVIPIHFVYLEATLGICGGGIVVAFSLFYVVLSDITPTSQM